MASVNRFRATCCSCGSTVEAGQGICERSQGKWLTYHKEGRCVERDLSFSHVKPDQYQQAIIENICQGKDAPHLLVVARAGSGKTTILCKGVTQLYQSSRGIRILSLAFGNEDGCRMRENLPLEVTARTTHSWAMEVVRDHFPGAKFDKSKYYKLLQTMVGDGDDTASLRGWVDELIDKVQADAVMYDDVAGIEAVVKEYGLAISPAFLKQVVTLASKALLVGLNYAALGFDFNDALHAVATQDIPLPTYDVVTWDESQDLNRAQLVLLNKFITAGSRMIVVLDPAQQIYLFRGSKAKGFDYIKELLSQDRGVTELPMPVSRRNAKAIVALAQRYVGDIEALPDAPEGIVKTGIPMLDMVAEWKPGEYMVLCRNNRPLIALKYHCLRNNIPAFFRGGMKEAGFLTWLVKMFAEKLGPITDNVSTVMERARQHLDNLAQAGSKRLSEYQDRIETIGAISEHVITVKELKQEIRKLFAAPPEGRKYITLSTIHLAKGSEAERVWHICPELIAKALARAKSPEAKAQEMPNAAYIAVTRAKTAYFETTGSLDEAA